MPFLLSQLIEAARAFGALVVLLVHVNNLFINQIDVMRTPQPVYAYVWWFFSGTQFGHQAVMGFFVLSGWLVGGPALTKMAGGPHFLRDYVPRRVARIYVVFLPALLLSLALDSFGRVLFTDSGVYGWTYFVERYSATLFLFSLFNLQRIFFECFGSNSAMWSLACEFWYYLTFPLLILPLARGVAPKWRFGGFALGVAIVALLSSGQAAWNWFGPFFVIWVMGAFAARAPRPLLASRWLSLGVYVAAIIVIRLVVRGQFFEDHPWLGYVVDVVAAALFCNLLLAFRDAPQTGFAALRLPIFAPFAAFSYSLYAVHMPIAFFFRAAAGEVIGKDWPALPAAGAHYALASAAFVTIVALAYGFSRLTEAKTDAVRRAAVRWLEQRMSARALSIEPAFENAPAVMPAKAGIQSDAIDP